MTKFNIEPHFDVNNYNIIQREAVLKESYRRIIYGLPDGSYIEDNKVYGMCYRIYKGNIKLICNDDEMVEFRKESVAK